MAKQTCPHCNFTPQPIAAVLCVKCKLPLEPARATVTDPNVLIEFACSGCKRSWKAKRADVAEKARRKLPCQMCGAKIDYPADLMEAAAAVPVVDPKKSSGSMNIIKPPCAVCERRVLKSTGDKKFSCETCGTALIERTAGILEVDRLPAAVGVSAEETDAMASKVAPHPLMGLLRNVLGARAKLGELAVDELSKITSNFDSLCRWRRTPGKLELPMGMEIAEDMLVNVLFEDARQERRAVGSVVLRFTLARGSDATGKPVLAHGHCTLTVAKGTTTSPGTPGMQTTDLRVTPESGQGLQQQVLSTALKGGGITRLAPELESLIVRRRDPMLVYIVRAAIVGAFGKPALLAAPKHLESRLRSLGGGLAADASTLAGKLALNHTRAVLEAQS